MNAPRNINASVFTTVMCACLGLLVAGTPLQAHARQAIAEAGQTASVATICSGFEASVVASFQELNVEQPWLQDSSSQAEVKISVTCYQNTKALVRKNQVLIVTRLARAALSDFPVKQPKAS